MPDRGADEAEKEGCLDEYDGKLSQAAGHPDRTAQEEVGEISIMALPFKEK